VCPSGKGFRSFSFFPRSFLAAICFKLGRKPPSIAQASIGKVSTPRILVCNGVEIAPASCVASLNRFGFFLPLLQPSFFSLRPCRVHNGSGFQLPTSLLRAPRDDPTQCGGRVVRKWQQANPLSYLLSPLFFFFYYSLFPFFVSVTGRMRIVFARVVFRSPSSQCVPPIP